RAPAPCLSRPVPRTARRRSPTRRGGVPGWPPAAAPATIGSWSQPVRPAPDRLPSNPGLHTLQRKAKMDENKKRALSAALGQIEKQFGKGSVMRMGDGTAQAVEAIPTGSLQLDLALGIGGLPKGRVVEIYGPESS